MPRSTEPTGDLGQIVQKIKTLRRSLAALDPTANEASTADRFVDQAGKLIDDLRLAREKISPIKFGPIGITLGRSDSIAKFFAFSFVNQEKRNLAELSDSPFYGSGVYAVYYHGKSEKAYLPLSGTETPIYVGKADPKDPYAETVEAQGQAIFLRLREHAKNIAKTDLNLNEFHYRHAAIQTGMQAAVEEFMIRLFRPIWNKEVKICFGIGKHGDNARTRANKRSPWDTMHPGRKWAVDTAENQMERHEIKTKIASHFEQHAVIQDKDVLYKLLSLG